MTKNTHIAGGVLAATSFICLANVYTDDFVEGGVASALSLVGAIAMISGASQGALLPDIEKKGSSISSRHKFISFLTRIIFTHRGFTHSLLALILVGLVIFPLGLLIPKGIGLSYATGFVLGYLSHLVLDALNSTGVPFFYPLNKKFSIARIKTDSFTEAIFRLVIVSLILVVIYAYITKIFAGKIDIESIKGSISAFLVGL